MTKEFPTSGLDGLPEAPERRPATGGQHIVQDIRGDLRTAIGNGKPNGIAQETDVQRGILNEYFNRLGVPGDTLDDKVSRYARTFLANVLNRLKVYYRAQSVLRKLDPSMTTEKYHKKVLDTLKQIIFGLDPDRFPNGAGIFDHLVGEVVRRLNIQS